MLRTKQFIAHTNYEPKQCKSVKRTLHNWQAYEAHRRNDENPHWAVQKNGISTYKLDQDQTTTTTITVKVKTLHVHYTRKGFERIPFVLSLTRMDCWTTMKLSPYCGHFGRIVSWKKLCRIILRVRLCTRKKKCLYVLVYVFSFNGASSLILNKKDIDLSKRMSRISTQSPNIIENMVSALWREQK